MSPFNIIRAAAISVAAIVFLFGAVSCSSSRLDSGGRPGDYDMNMSDEAGGIDMNAVEVDVGGDNAMAAPERPDFESGPPPPPPPPSAAERDGPEYSLPATDTAPARNYATAARASAGYTGTSTFAGLGAFVKPPVWIVGTSYTLEFVVGHNDAGLAAVSHNRALTGRSRIWMAPTMRVTLDQHPDFDIKPQNPDQEIQQLSPDGTANWFWNVVPHRAGKFTLVARVQAVTVGPDGEPLRDAQGRPKGRFYPAQQVEVKVRVGAREGAMNAIKNTQSFGEAFTGLFKTWEGTLGALAALIAAAGGVWAAIRKLKGKPIRPRMGRRGKSPKKGA